MPTPAAATRRTCAPPARCTAGRGRGLPRAEAPNSGPRLSAARRPQREPRSAAITERPGRAGSTAAAPLKVGRRRAEGAAPHASTSSPACGGGASVPSGSNGRRDRGPRGGAGRLTGRPCGSGPGDGLLVPGRSRAPAARAPATAVCFGTKCIFISNATFPDPGFSKFHVFTPTL